METKVAAADSRQPFTYFDLSKEGFTPEWLPPDAVGGVPTHIAEDFKLATDQNKKDFMELVTVIGKAFRKTRFFTKEEHWMITWARLLPALLVSKQWTLVA